jgi:hypothetical protein
VQLLIVNRVHGSYLRGDILAAVPDVHVWGPFEVMSRWSASDEVAFPNGLPDDLVGVSRTTGNFPNPQFAVVRFPSYRCDLNLAEAWLDSDGGGGTEVIGRRLWWLDLDDLPPGQRNSLEAPGGEATLGANRLPAIKNRHDGLSVTDVPAWDSDTTQGNIRQRHPGTMTRDRLGVL